MTDDMKPSKKYRIVLPKGEAPRPFFELTENERHDIGVKIFRYVTELAAEIGEVPVTTQSISHNASKEGALFKT